jgi:hypothetical protein
VLINFNGRNDFISEIDLISTTGVYQSKSYIEGRSVWELHIEEKFFSIRNSSFEGFCTAIRAHDLWVGRPWCYKVYQGTILFLDCKSQVEIEILSSTQEMYNLEYLKYLSLNTRNIYFIFLSFNRVQKVSIKNEDNADNGPSFPPFTSP